MRITNSMVMSQYTKQLNENIERVSYDSERSSSGRAYLRASEDPVAAAQTISTASQLKTVKQYQSNISGAQSWMTETESAVKSFTNVLTSANTTLNSAASSGTNSDTNDSALATTLEGYQTQLLSALNSTYSGQYVFGGSTSGLAPFKAGTADDYTDYKTAVSTYESTYNSTYTSETTAHISATDAAADAAAKALKAASKISSIAPVATTTTNSDGTITMTASLTEDDIKGKLLYLTPGTNQYIPVSQISADAVPSGSTETDLSYYSTQNSAMTRSMPIDLGFGTQVSSGSVVSGTAFEASTDPLSFLLQTKGANGTNNVYDDYGYTADKLSESDSSSASNSLAFNTDTSTSASMTNAVLGEKENMLSFLSDKYTSDNTNMTSHLSDVEDIDATTAYTQYSLDEIVYQASLSISSTILQNNLTNFLK